MSCALGSSICRAAGRRCEHMQSELAQVVDVHIIKHKDTNKPRGCFVEFATRDDLEKALLRDGTVRLAHLLVQPPCRFEGARSAHAAAQSAGKALMSNT